MDVLFNSIDVRDLLPSNDLDATSPLSAPDLRLLIDRLNHRSLNIKSAVRSHLLRHRHHFSSLFSSASSAVSQSSLISNQVLELIESISESPVDVEVKSIVDEIRRKKAEVEERREAAELVRVLLGLAERLGDVKVELKAGRVLEAAEELRDLKAALRVDKEKEREPVVYGLLKRQWRECFEEMQEVLLKFMENAVRFDQQADTFFVKYSLAMNESDHVELHTVLKAMDVVGILDYGFAKVADLLVKFIITPAVKRGSLSSVAEETTLDSGDVNEMVLRIVSSSDFEPDNVNVEALYSGLFPVIKFFFNSICFQNHSWMRCFGRLTWPRMSELIISNILSKVVPTDASKLADFQKILRLTVEFETSLKEINFISTSDASDERLRNFADNVEVHFASRKKVEILAKARNLLLSSASILHQDFGWSNYCDDVLLLFSSERCVVSKAASQLVELMHHTLKDICVSSTRVALEFYHAVRDALVLYEAIVPVKLEKQLGGMNEVAMLIHNDCLFLSQEILGLAYEYRPDLPSSIKNAVFVDLAVRYQVMAEELMQKQMQLVINDLKEAIDGADGFQNTHQMKEYQSASRSINNVDLILGDKRGKWEALLPPSVYKRSMCMLLEAVVSRMTQDILLLDDIGAEESLQLQSLIHLLLDKLSPYLESLRAVNQTHKSQEAFSRYIDDFIPSLHKIHRLADMLDMPMESITVAWEKGELVSCGYSSSEVVDFIRAVFADSENRNDCLRRIQRANF